MATTCGTSSAAVRRASLAFLALIILVALSPRAAAAASTLYVDKSAANCSDSGAGSQSQPFCTINAGASKVAAGDTVQVAAGTYSEEVVVPRSGTSSAPITFTTAPGATVTVTGKAHGFTLSTVSWITVRGFSVTKTTGAGISVSSSSHITLSANQVTYAGQRVSGKTADAVKLSGVSDSLVEGNTCAHNSDYGVELTSSSTRDEIRGNHTFDNARGYQRAAAGIRLYSSPSNTVAANVTHDNEDSGIESYTGSNNTLLYNNVTYNNGDHGIDNYQSTGQRVIANTVYKNVTAGINVEGSSTGATVSNNISVDNGINSPRTHSNIRIESGSTSGTTMNDDLVNLTTSDVMLIWNSTSYNSLSAFRSATGQESRGIQADPRWGAPASGDFHLAAGSPAIDSANSGASGQPAADVEGHPRVDDPNTPNTGVGPRPYDDRGAYEFGPRDAPPVAALTVTPASGTIDLNVTADASASTDTDATGIATYSFDFGDGSIGPGAQASPIATHTYRAPGVYTVKVTVTDTAGLASTATSTVTVTDAPPAAALAVTPSSGLVDLAVTADASASTDTDASRIASYSFDFGDGSTSGPQSTATATHTYTQPGAYTVEVTVTDSAGLSSTSSAPVTVTDAPPAPALTVNPATGTAPLAVSADASASTDGDATGIVSYAFDFGDGTATVGPQPDPVASHTYDNPGSYVVKVTVTDAAGQAASTSATVRVASSNGNVPPNAALSVTPSSGNAPLRVNADASASTDDGSITSYSFDFGDGSSTGAQPGAAAAHTYDKAGTYTVTVTVTDDGGLTSTASAQVVVADTPPSASLNVTPSSGAPPLVVVADASASTDPDGTPISSYDFDFGDGAATGAQSASTATHTYTSSGSYTVKVTVTDSAGHSSTASSTVNVVANLVGNPGFESSLSGWNTSSASSSAVVLSRVSGGHSGSWSARLSNTGTTAATCLLNDSPNWVTTTKAGTYTGSLWVRSDTAGAVLKLRFREYDSAGTLLGTATTQTTLTTSWQQVVVTYTPTRPDASALDFNAYVSSAAPGVCFDADDASIEVQ
jgi:parallel beta-helix repeat protein